MKYFINYVFILIIYYKYLSVISIFFLNSGSVRAINKEHLSELLRATFLGTASNK